MWFNSSINERLNSENKNLLLEQEESRSLTDPAFPAEENRSLVSFSDRSMLEALGSPGERSILSDQTKVGNGDGESREDGGTQQDDEKKREREENGGGHRSVHSEEESSERKDGKRRDEKEHAEESDEDLMTENKGESRL